MDIKQILMELVRSSAAIEARLDRIEADVKDHMRRTHNLEGRVDQVMEHISNVKFIITLTKWIIPITLSVVGTLIAYLALK